MELNPIDKALMQRLEENPYPAAGLERERDKYVVHAMNDLKARFDKETLKEAGLIYPIDIGPELEELAGSSANSPGPDCAKGAGSQVDTADSSSERDVPKVDATVNLPHANGNAVAADADDIAAKTTAAPSSHKAAGPVDGLEKSVARPPRSRRSESDMATPDEEGIRLAVDDAEEVLDPLDGLVDRAKDNPGAPFEEEVLERLAELKKEDLAEFERLRTVLKKKSKVRVTALDKAIRARCGDDSRPPSHADILLELAEGVHLFHAPDRTAYADIEVAGHRETWPIRCRGFKLWLGQRYFERTEGAPSSEALQSAINVIEARAVFDGPECEAYLRVAGHDGGLYLDLADDRWRAVEIRPDGWRVVEQPPVRFRRPTGMLPLPVPKPGGSVSQLRRFLNVASEGDFVLAVAWALAVLQDRGPYPVLVLAGEQGSAKSTLAAILRALLDPNSAPLRALAREDRDLFIAATNGHVLAFDNVSGLPPWISDTLCRLATGGGFAVRQLYTDQDEVLFDATRPAILNGIEDFVTRPDLADRAIFLTLEAIPEEQRRPEKELWRDLEQERPLILGALLDAVARGLNELPNTSLDRLPRMAEFALWATACEAALWPSGTFLAAYDGNRGNAVDTVIDTDPVASEIRSLMTTRTVWTGTASELLGALGDQAGDTVRKAKTWPADPSRLSGRLRRAATFLRKVGIDIEHTKEGRAGTRIITILAAPDDEGIRPSAPSAPSAPDQEPCRSNVLGADGRDASAGDADADGHFAGGRPTATVCGNPLKSRGADGADGADAKSPHDSATGENGTPTRGWETDL